MRRAYGKVTVSTATGQSPARDRTPRPRAPRFPAAIPVDVTVLRSGIPYTIPGRSTNFGEGGMGAMLAGELTPGDLVGVVFRVPDIDAPIRARALVRHQLRLQCGLSFVGLLPEQQMTIERWSRRMAKVSPANRFQEIARTVAPEPAPILSLPQPASQGYRILFLGLAILLIVGAGGWWRWHQGWRELESRIQRVSVSSKPPTRVAANSMEPLLIHRVEPVLPEANQASPVQGEVVLDVIVGQDGAVVSARALSGPDLLAAAATDAVRWWRYQPYLIDGQPMEVETTVTINFKAPNAQN